MKSVYLLMHLHTWKKENVFVFSDQWSGMNDTWSNVIIYMRANNSQNGCITSISRKTSSSDIRGLIWYVGRYHVWVCNYICDGSHSCWNNWSWEEGSWNWSRTFSTGLCSQETHHKVYDWIPLLSPWHNGQTFQQFLEGKVKLGSARTGSKSVSLISLEK